VRFIKTINEYNGRYPRYCKATSWIKQFTLIIAKQCNALFFLFCLCHAQLNEDRGYDWRRLVTHCHTPSHAGLRCSYNQTLFATASRVRPLKQSLVHLQLNFYVAIIRSVHIGILLNIYNLVCLKSVPSFTICVDQLPNATGYEAGRTPLC
jgi:hypothetical protein